MRCTAVPALGLRFVSPAKYSPGRGDTRPEPFWRLTEPCPFRETGRATGRSFSSLDAAENQGVGSLHGLAPKRCEDRKRDRKYWRTGPSGTVDAESGRGLHGSSRRPRHVDAT